MKNDSNIYDIDGNLVRAAGDTHTWSIDEAKNKIEEYRKKLSELAPNDKKAVVYATYMRNLSNYLMVLYSKLSKGELENLLKTRNNDNKIKEALEELKNDVENDGNIENSTKDEIYGTTPKDSERNEDTKSGDDNAIERAIRDIFEEKPTTQDDLLVERSEVTNNMDEYVDFEDVNDENNIQ